MKAVRLISDRVPKITFISGQPIMTDRALTKPCNAGEIDAARLHNFLESIDQAHYALTHGKS